MRGCPTTRSWRPRRASCRATRMPPPASRRARSCPRSAPDRSFDLEKFRLIHQGKAITPVDRNYWGVTFASDDDSLLRHGDVRRGDVAGLGRASAAATIRTIRPDAECPSLSPDGTRVAYKKLADRAPGTGGSPCWTSRHAQRGLLAEDPQCRRPGRVARRRHGPLRAAADGERGGRDQPVGGGRRRQRRATAAHREGLVARGRALRRRPRRSAPARGCGGCVATAGSGRRGARLPRMQRPVTDLPKAHLHLHFTGSMRVETVRDLADEARPAPARRPDDGLPAAAERARRARLVPVPAPVRRGPGLRRATSPTCAASCARPPRTTPPRDRAGSRSRSTRRPTRRSSGASRRPSRSSSTRPPRHPARGRPRSRSSWRRAGSATRSTPGRWPGWRPSTPARAPGQVVGFGAQQRRASRPDRRVRPCLRHRPAGRAGRWCHTPGSCSARRRSRPRWRRSAPTGSATASAAWRTRASSRLVAESGVTLEVCPAQQRRARGLRQRRRGAAAHDRRRTAYPSRWGRRPVAVRVPAGRPVPARPRRARASPTTSWPTWRAGSRHGRRAPRPTSASAALADIDAWLATPPPDLARPARILKDVPTVSARPADP